MVRPVAGLMLAPEVWTRQSESVTARSPTSNERAFLDGVLNQSFDGVRELRKQWEPARVESSCDCGCGSIGFVFDPNVQLPRSGARSPIPVEGEIVDGDGEVIGGIIVLLRERVLHDVDVYDSGDGALPFPAPGSIRWVGLLPDHHSR